MEEKIQFSVSDLNVLPVSTLDAEEISVFQCGESHLDSFFHDELILCAKYHYLSPYCVKLNNSIVVLFTLSNDTLALEYEDKIFFPNLNREYDDIFQRQTSFPAINIGHLGVRKDFQSHGIGLFAIDFVVETFKNFKISGCQFITVDALNNNDTLRFYSDKAGFEFQTVSDLNKPTRRMYLDIFTK